MRAIAIGSLALLAATAAWSQEPAELLEQARTDYEARADAARAKAAVEGFARAAAADPTSYAALWEGARAVYAYGQFTRGDAPDGEKMATFQDGIDRANAAVSLRPDGVEGHFWLGVLTGVYGEAKGIFKSLSLVPVLRREMETCLRLDPAVEAHGPDRVLGRLFFKLPFFKGGDNEKSAFHLERSLAGTPSNELTRLYLAETYKALGKKREAVEQLRWILDTPPDPRWAPEHPWVAEQARRLLRKLE